MGRRFSWRSGIQRECNSLDYSTSPIQFLVYTSSFTSAFSLSDSIAATPVSHRVCGSWTRADDYTSFLPLHFLEDKKNTRCVIADVKLEIQS